MKYIIYCLILAQTATSCYHVYYAPNTANSPMLSEKGETRFNAAYCGGGSSEFEGGELQAAAAIGKHTGVMINSMFVSKSESVSNYDGSNTHTESGRGSYVEFGGGMFKSFDAKQRWIGEVYGGVGFGNSKHTYDYSEKAKVGVTKFFLQPSVGYKSNYFEVSLVPRVGYVNWKVREENLQAVTGSYDEDEDDLNKIRQKPGFLCFEPALIVRAGGKDVKIQGALSLSHVNGGDYYPVENVSASIGVSINLGAGKK